ncbi:Similar to hypothetical protein [Tuber melanosporum Mel28]; acc. no. XP_002838685 [Pyronema omphalodes CBS 100304]|uniref:C2H2-type domain-containing protein n=1 Tax=Pyronema omphalodes (strain CBS 100304) TaxID=1076935 RepID=U4L2F6_PYROM|nr:Similar to hypothetical protein [Tuber melanosporum Mel28]; acc. no. XP_002838685 [Pyronema omphalodes CBS 100304]
MSFAQHQPSNIQDFNAEPTADTNEAHTYTPPNNVLSHGSHVQQQTPTLSPQYHNSSLPVMASANMPRQSPVLSHQPYGQRQTLQVDHGYQFLTSAAAHVNVGAYQAHGNATILQSQSTGQIPQPPVAPSQAQQPSWGPYRNSPVMMGRRTLHQANAGQQNNQQQQEQIRVYNAMLEQKLVEATQQLQNGQVPQQQALVVQNPQLAQADQVNFAGQERLEQQMQLISDEQRVPPERQTILQNHYGSDQFHGAPLVPSGLVPRGHLHSSETTTNTSIIPQPYSRNDIPTIPQKMPQQHHPLIANSSLVLASSVPHLDNDRTAQLQHQSQWQQFTIGQQDSVMEDAMDEELDKRQLERDLHEWKEVTQRLQKYKKKAPGVFQSVLSKYSSPKPAIQAPASAPASSTKNPTFAVAALPTSRHQIKAPDPLVSTSSTIATLSALPLLQSKDAKLAEKIMTEKNTTQTKVNPLVASGSTAVSALNNHPIQKPTAQARRTGLTEPRRTIVSKAAAEYLTKNGKPISATYLSAIFAKTSEIGPVCAFLESQGHKIDRQAFSLHLLTALGLKPPSTKEAQTFQTRQPTNNGGKILGEVDDQSQHINQPSMNWQSSARPLNMPLQNPGAQVTGQGSIAANRNQPFTKSGTNVSIPAFPATLFSEAEMKKIADELAKSKEYTSQLRNAEPSTVPLQTSVVVDLTSDSDPKLARRSIPNIPVAEGISPYLANTPSTRTAYDNDPTILAKQVLIVAGLHRKESHLNSHLLPLLKTLPPHILPRNADLSTLRWDLLDPKPRPPKRQRPGHKHVSNPQREHHIPTDMAHDSSSKRRRVTATTAVATPGTNTVDLSDNHETRSHREFKKFECRWGNPKCNVVLHNLDTLWKHIKIVHGRQEELCCHWGACTGTVPMDRGYWEMHIGRHVETVKQLLGNGPKTMDTDPKTTNIRMDYLFNNLGHQITPVAYPSSPDHVFTPPPGFRANRQFRLAHGASPKSAKSKSKAAANLETWNAALDRARGLGAGMEGSPAPPIPIEEEDWWSNVTEEGIMKEVRFEVDENWP